MDYLSKPTEELEELRTSLMTDIIRSSEAQAALFIEYTGVINVLCDRWKDEREVQAATYESEVVG